MENLNFCRILIRMLAYTFDSLNMLNSYADKATIKSWLERQEEPFEVTSSADEAYFWIKESEWLRTRFLLSTRFRDVVPATCRAPSLSVYSAASYNGRATQFPWTLVLISIPGHLELLGRSVVSRRRLEVRHIASRNFGFNDMPRSMITCSA